MAPPITPLSLNPADLGVEEDLSQEQMEALLQRAEKRLKAAAASKGSREEVLHFYDSSLEGNSDKYVDVLRRWCLPLSCLRILKLRSGAATPPYVSLSNGIAHADPRRLLSDSERRLSNQPRSGEDPINVKEQKKKVRQNYPT